MISNNGNVYAYTAGIAITIINIIIVSLSTLNFLKNIMNPIGATSMNNGINTHTNYLEKYSMVEIIVLLFLVDRSSSWN